MTVPRQAVVWAYRLLLGREPENEAVVTRYMLAASITELRDTFLASQEFLVSANAQAAPLGIGRHQNVASIDVDMACSPAELDRMLAGIAGEWRTFGTEDPHWSVVTSEEFRSENIGRNIDAFFKLGEDQMKMMLNPLSRSSVPTARFGKAMDFGCGVGRLTFPLAALADEVVGVDISPPHIRLAQEQAHARGLDHVRFVTIDAVADLDAFTGFDLIVSVIVLQHNPPPVAAEILRKLLRALAPGGSAIIQLPTYIAGQRFSTHEYLASRQPAMEMNGVPQHVIFAIADAAGCRLLEVREDTFMGTDIGLSHTFAFQKKG